MDVQSFSAIHSQNHFWFTTSTVIFFLTSVSSKPLWVIVMVAVPNDTASISYPSPSGHGVTLTTSGLSETTLVILKSLPSLFPAVRLSPYRMFPMPRPLCGSIASPSSMP